MQLLRDNLTLWTSDMQVQKSNSTHFGTMVDILKQFIIQRYSDSGLNKIQVTLIWIQKIAISCIWHITRESISFSYYSCSLDSIRRFNWWVKPRNFSLKLPFSFLPFSINAQVKRNSTLLRPNFCFDDLVFRMMVLMRLKKLPPSVRMKSSEISGSPSRVKLLLYMFLIGEDACLLLLIWYYPEFSKGSHVICCRIVTRATNLVYFFWLIIIYLKSVLVSFSILCYCLFVFFFFFLFFHLQEEHFEATASISNIKCGCYSTLIAHLTSILSPS